MNKKLTIKLLLACSLVVTGLFGSMIAASPKASAATQQSLDLVAYGKEHLGTPYQYGAEAGVTYAFDCSSYVQYVFDQFGIELPRTSISQAYTGEKVDKAYLSVGDLVFFRTGGNGISHVAIYAGDGKILHASSSQGVTVSNMNSSYWTKNYVTARRVL
ncbi:C40 family peptidase [Cohnella herbarum]|uniref:C40 family peptidase n=1 Tax=Cohnella herbarum TaxID=2728023 RepID=A0A7Z2VKS9_9BACL|nr:C40 family peptidase [Cohnella herbarum]QJD84856.1 C40 family peptidase [Cohnella herbarum]